MKKLYGFAFAAASLLLTSGAHAQTVHVRADVPFDFAVGNKLYAAGTYEIQSATKDNSAVILRADGRREEGMALIHSCSSANPAPKTELVFKQVGGEYFLSQIWLQGSERGGELAQPKRETRLARDGKTEEVVIAANMVK